MGSQSSGQSKDRHAWVGGWGSVCLKHTPRGNDGHIPGDWELTAESTYGVGSRLRCADCAWPEVTHTSRKLLEAVPGVLCGDG